MNRPVRLSDLIPGLVIAAGGRTLTEPETNESAPLLASAQGGKARMHSAPNRHERAHTADRWLLCAIAEQLASSVVEGNCRSTGPVYVERISWPKGARAGDELELKIEILDKKVSASGACAFVRWRWLLATRAGEPVLELISATMLEERVQHDKLSTAEAPMAYKVSGAAAMLGVSRYVLYEAIREQRLRAFRPKARSDFMILAEDLREWITRHQVHPNDSG